jgi:hypothetical protein
MRRLVLAVVVCVGGCGGSGGGGDDDSGGDSEQACLDMADAVADAAVRCAAGTYQENYDALVEAAACGDCGNIVSLRDRSDLYAECIPSFETISCDELTGGNLDASCAEQLQRERADCADY